MNVENADKEAVFITGINQTIKESDIKELFAKVIRSEPTVRFHYFSVLNQPRVIAEVLLSHSDALLAYQYLNNSQIKGLNIKIDLKTSMTAIIITNLPAIISEKDLFLIIARMTPGLKRLTIADDPEICGKTVGLAVVSYQTHEAARRALEAFQTTNMILGKKVSAVWKEPTYDVMVDIARDTRVIYIKNIALETTIDHLREILYTFGDIVRITKLADSAYVEFEDSKSARRALEQCQEKQFDGLTWRIFPAKRLDEEKKKEYPYRNIMYSKSFLEETDQQVLLKFAFDGAFPEIPEQMMQSAASIIQGAKNFQNSSLQGFKMQYEMLLANGNQVQESQGDQGNEESKTGEDDQEEEYIQIKNSSYHHHHHKNKKHKKKHRSRSPHESRSRREQTNGTNGANGGVGQNFVQTKHE